MSKSIIIVFVTILISGCASFNSEKTHSQMRLNNQLSSMDAEINSLKEQMNSTVVANERLSEQMVSINKNNDQRINQLELEIDRLKTELSSIKSHNEAMKQEIIDTLSKKIANIMQSVNSSSGSGKGVEHVVGPGETLSKIASAYGVTVSAIVRENKLKNPNNIRQGQKLFIPR